MLKKKLLCAIRITTYKMCAIANTYTICEEENVFQYTALLPEDSAHISLNRCLLFPKLK